MKQCNFDVSGLAGASQDLILGLHGASGGPT
jgi:hypothetical protein